MTLRCPVALTDGPRAGQVCGRIFLVPHKVCVRHRPPLPQKPRTTTRDAAKRNAEGRRKSLLAGLPAGWEAA